MQDRSKSSARLPIGESKRPTSGLLFGLDAVNAGGSNQERSASRLGLRISRRWARIAPTMRLSLAVGSTLETIREEHCAWLTGLLRAGVSMRKIVRLNLDDMRLNRGDREALLKSVIKERKPNVE